MNYLEVIKRSFQIIWKNKFLWFFGFFLGGASSFGGFNFGNSFKTQEKDGEQLQGMFWQARDLFLTHLKTIIPILIIIGALLIIFVLFMIIMRILSRSALIKGVNKLDENIQTSLKESFKEGKSYFFKIIGVSLLFLIVKLIIIGIPLAFFVYGFFLAFLKEGSILPSFIVFSVFGFFLFIIAASVIVAILKLIQKYAYNFLVLKDQKILESIKNGFNLFKKFWKQSALMWLWLLLISLALGFIIFLAIIVLILPFLLLGFILYLILKTVGIVIAVSFGALVMIVFFAVLRGGVTAFYETIWILTFKRLSEKESAETQAIPQNSEKAI